MEKAEDHSAGVGDRGTREEGRKEGAGGQLLEFVSVKIGEAVHSQLGKKMMALEDQG